MDVCRWLYAEPAVNASAGSRGYRSRKAPKVLVSETDFDVILTALPRVNTSPLADRWLGVRAILAANCLPGRRPFGLSVSRPLGSPDTGNKRDSPHVRLVRRRWRQALSHASIPVTCNVR